MTDNPNLGADLVALWKAGTENYPAVADEYAVALAFIDATDRGLPYAFQRPGTFGGGTFGPVHERWRALRDELATALHQTRTSLVDTAAVLRMAVLLYDETDAEAAAQLKEAMADHDLSYPPRDDRAGGSR